MQYFRIHYLIPLLLLTGSALAQMAPSGINYQGWIANDQGEPHPGPQADLVFSLFLDSGGTNLVWRKTEEDVVVADGSFNVILDQGDGSFGSIASALTSSDSTVSSDRFLGISVNGGPDIEPRHKLLAVPYAVSAGNGNPIGTIIPFHDFEGRIPIPEGYMRCDGSTLNDPESPLDGLTLPDLNGRFLKGASTSGTTGGEVKSGTATDVDLNDHKHQTATFRHENGITYRNNLSPFGETTSSVSVQNVSAGGLGATFTNRPMQLTNTVDASASSDLNLHKHSIDPPHLEVIYLIRVK